MALVKDASASARKVIPAAAAARFAPGAAPADLGGVHDLLFVFPGAAPGERAAHRRPDRAVAAQSRSRLERHPELVHSRRRSLSQLVRLASGDARRALTALEASAGAAQDRGSAVIEHADVERAVDRALAHYDRAGDQHYDVISAFIKSIRGSDVDAALHYLARMVDAGLLGRKSGRGFYDYGSGAKP